MFNQTFQLLIQGRGGIVFAGEVESISSVNEKGKFDVLSQHANFISLIEKELIIRELNGNIQEMKISNGLMRVRENVVEVYLGVEGTKPAKINE